MSKSLTNKAISHLIINSKDDNQLSKIKSNLSIKIKPQKIKQPLKNIFLNDSNNESNINSFFTSKKSIFSKISENLYNSYRDNFSSSKHLLSLKADLIDNYSLLTTNKYIMTLDNKEKSISNTLLKKNYRKVYLKNNKFKNNLTESKTLSENNEIILSTTKRNGYKKKIRTPAEFLADQKKYLKKHKIHIENIVKAHKIKFNKSIKKKPTISNDSRRIANNLKIKSNENMNIFYKLYNDYSLREKSKEEMRKKSDKEYYRKLGIFSNKILTKKIIKQNSERLYKDYIKKDLYIKEIKNKQLNQLKIMALTKYINKSSNNILFGKFINKYENILNSQFNKTIEDNFEINFQEYLRILIEFPIIDNYYKILFKNEEEKNHLKTNAKSENQNISSLWKNKYVFKSAYTKKKRRRKKIIMK